MQHKLKLDDIDEPTKLGKFLERWYGVSKNGKVRILHPIGGFYWLLALFFGSGISFLSFDEPPYKLWDCIEEMYKELKSIFDWF